MTLQAPVIASTLEAFCQARDNLQTALIDLSGMIAALHYLMGSLGSIGSGQPLPKEVRDSIYAVSAATVRALEATQRANAEEHGAWLEARRQMEAGKC